MKTQQISAEYITHSGDDLLVVNAARASFDKESQLVDGTLKEADANLVRFLASGYRTGEWDDLLEEVIHTARDMDMKDAKEILSKKLKEYKRKAQHWAPFGHPHLTIRMTLPVFLARQFVKHQVGATWSESSRRYISDEPGVWFPDEWHTRPADIKQGSGAPVDEQDVVSDAAQHATGTAISAYKDMLAHGVAPEEARTILPLNMMTTVVWTGSLLFWSRVHNQRVDSHAQLAAQELARLISEIVQPLYPVSWGELTE